MALLICQICGKSFESKGRNAKYCTECASDQKKQKDHEAWLRRRNKRAELERYEMKLCAADRIELEGRLKKELGLSEFFFRLWKADNPMFLRTWMREQVGSCKASIQPS